MKEEYQRNRILARGKEVFTGIDVHKESWQVQVASEGKHHTSQFSKETNIIFSLN